MADMSDELIKRLEAADEGSRELDEAIWVKTHGRQFAGRIPHYTTSLDAALTLVPEGWWTSHAAGGNPGVEGRPFEPKWYWGLTRHAQADDGPETVKDTEGEASTPALAVCIAARKARQAQEKPPTEAGG